MFPVLRAIRIAFATAVATLVFALVGGAGAGLHAPALTIGSVTIDGDAAVVTGVVNAAADLEVNGVLVDVSDSGEFLAVVDLDADAVVLALAGVHGEAIEIRIPIDVLLAIGGNGILDDLAAAGIEIDMPDGGFQIVDGQMPVVEGRVLDDSTLESLEINGVDVLRGLGQGSVFSIALPGSSTSQPERVVVVATDRSGVSQTNRFATTNVTSAIRTRAGTSVSAAGAQGVVISRVRLDTRQLAKTKRFGVVVTVKDRRGYLIRGAALRVSAKPQRHLATGAVRAGFTGRLGQARFTYRLRSGAVATASKQFLTIATRASTPRASASLQVKLRLPASTPR
jgi:hypothetical protein